MRLGVATFTALTVGAVGFWGWGQGSSLLPALAKVMQAGSKPSTEASSSAPAPAEAPTAPEPGKQFYYQYVDDEGSVRFAFSLEQVPAAWRDRAGKVEMSGPPPSRPAEARDARDERTRHLRAPRAVDPEPGSMTLASARSGEVILYGTESCGACKMARAHLARRGVAFDERDIEDGDPNVLREYLTKSGGRPGVPLLDVDGQIMQGYNSRRLDELLDAL